MFRYRQYPIICPQCLTGGMFIFPDKPQTFFFVVNVNCEKCSLHFVQVVHPKERTIFHSVVDILPN